MSAKTIFMAGVMAVSSAAALAQKGPYDDYMTNPDVKYDARGYASCKSSISAGDVPQKNMPTSFANQFWTRMNCMEMKGAYQLLDAAPKTSPDRGIPNPFSAKTEWSKCYWDSFAYGPEFHKERVVYDTNGITILEQGKVSHGFFIIPVNQFEKIQRAVVHACDEKLGFIKRAP